jgi:putative transcriptional regulator
MVVKWRVREVAERRGITTASELAERAGVNKNTAGALWNGRSLRVDRDTLAKLCQALDCTTGDLLEYNPNEIRMPMPAAA